MRDPNRIEHFLNILAQYWHLAPDLRFGQLIENIKIFSGINDLFYVEEEEFIKILEDYFSFSNKKES